VVNQLYDVELFAEKKLVLFYQVDPLLVSIFMQLYAMAETARDYLPDLFLHCLLVLWLERLLATGAGSCRPGGLVYH
jgi:hypothetical protein